MIKVLVVDDDPDVRQLLGAWLPRGEFELTVGVDGYQAVELAVKGQPDVILLDINMPAAKGFVVHERLKHLSGVSQIPIVYISADRTAESKALAAGAARFLAKPLEKENVLSTLREVCKAS